MDHSQEKRIIENILKRLIHTIVLLAFVVSTLLSIAIVMPVMAHQIMSHKTIEQSDGQHKQHYASIAMGTDRSCYKDKKTTENKNIGHHEKCCDDYQCMMNGCAKTQSLHHVLTPAFITTPKKLLFITGDERYEDSIRICQNAPPKT